MQQALMLTSICFASMQVYWDPPIHTILQHAICITLHHNMQYCISLHHNMRYCETVTPQHAALRYTSPDCTALYNIALDGITLHDVNLKPQNALQCLGLPVPWMQCGGNPQGPNRQRSHWLTPCDFVAHCIEANYRDTCGSDDCHALLCSAPRTVRHFESKSVQRLVLRHLNRCVGNAMQALCSMVQCKITDCMQSIAQSACLAIL